MNWNIEREQKKIRDISSGKIIFFLLLINQQQEKNQTANISKFGYISGLTFPDEFY